MDAAEALPPLPPGWRDEAVTMLFEFLEDAGLASTLDALEKETGCVPGRALSAPALTDLRASSARVPSVHRTRPLRDFSADVADPPLSPPTSPVDAPRAIPHVRRRGGSAATLCDALAHLRRLVLDGRWAAAEAFAAPEDDASSHPSVDRDAVRARLRTQAFLELLDDASAETAAAPDPDALVAALERLREVCDDGDADAEEASCVRKVAGEKKATRDAETKRFAAVGGRAPTFRDACAVLALGDVRAHPPLRAWTRARGRLATFEAVARALAPLYPEAGAEKNKNKNKNADKNVDGARHLRSGEPNERREAPGALELALRRAVAHKKQDATGGDGNAPVSLRSALGFELGDVRDGAGEGVESFLQTKYRSEDEDDAPAPSPALSSAPSPSFFVSSATSTRLRHEDLMGAFRETNLYNEERDSTRRLDDDDDDGSPRFALVGDVVRADAGVRCLTRCPRVFFPQNRAGPPRDGVGAFAAATSSRVLHVIADAGGARGCKTSSRHLDDAHAGPCSVYAVAWAAAEPGGGGVVATGANDGGLALTEVRHADGDEQGSLDENENEAFRFGRSRVARHAVRGGAIRAVAFVGAAASPDVDGDFDSGDYARAADARLVVAAGEGDFKPRAWHVDESGLAFAGPSFALGAHGGPVIAAAADPETRWLLFTASRAGEAFLWDLRESRGARETLACRPSLRCDVAGACGDGVGLASATIRGGRFAFGFTNGGVAAADARRGCNSVAFGGVKRVSFGGAGGSVVWSDVVHPGGECRSVDIAPRSSVTGGSGFEKNKNACAAFGSPFLILSGGFDGRVALSDASSAGRVAWRYDRAHADKVTAARFDARGAGFVSCGVDRVVKAWALRDSSDRS